MTATTTEPNTSNAPAALVLDHVSVAVRKATLLDEVSLLVESGSIVAVLGANGAGKTTLLDAVSGTMPHTGRIHVAGKRAKYRRGQPVVGVARVFQGSPLPDTLTVAEVIDVTARDRDRAREVMATFGLTNHSATFVSELSTGMRRILDLAIATIDEPALLLLDEPASGLAASEVERLAELVVDYRDRTGCAVLVVEHDPTFVQNIADEIVILDAGQVVRRGLTGDIMFGGHPEAATRVASPLDAEFRAGLASVAEVAADAEPPLRRQLSTWTKLRLGLREFAAGMASVLILGVLNRVMKVELGISLALVATLLASYNLAAPLAMAIGHQSDRRPIFGRHRTPYIIGGSMVTGVAVLLAPHVANALSRGITFGGIALALMLFIIMGIGMYSSGTVFFALIADLTPRNERGHAASIVYLELMLGIMAGVALSTTLLDDDAGGLTTLFAVVAVLVVLFTTIAVWGLEPKDKSKLDIANHDLVEKVTFRSAVKGVAVLPTARKFFLFMVVSTIFLFLQQAVLEPFGGEVLGLSVRATSGFNAIQTIGVLVGMIVTGRAVADRDGHKKTALVGLFGAAISFGFLTFAALNASAPPSWFAILFVGLSTGLFNVAVLALMMSMADPRRMALFMGAWTVAHAIADGIATAGGGLVYEAALWFAGGEAGAYATVFAIEGIGLALCIPLLKSMDPDKFAIEVATQSARHDAVTLGWLPEDTRIVDDEDTVVASIDQVNGDVEARRAAIAATSFSLPVRGGMPPTAAKPEPVVTDTPSSTNGQSDTNGHHPTEAKAVRRRKVNLPEGVR